MTWQDLADKIADMSPEQKSRPVRFIDGYDKVHHVSFVDFSSEYWQYNEDKYDVGWFNENDPYLE